jgi:3-oxoacyl-[acyl-carrier protein] reductase
MSSAERGLVPIVGYRRQAERATEIANACKGFALEIDLCSDASIQSAVRWIADHKEGLAGIVLTASPAPEIGPFGQISEGQLAMQWRVNVVGPQLLLAGLIRECLRKYRKGSVVGVLSKAMGDDVLHGASKGMGAYIIAKHGLQGLLTVVAAEYPWLRVRAVKPGYVETPMLKAFDERFLDLQREKMRFLTADEVGAMILNEGFEA